MGKQIVNVREIKHLAIESGFVAAGIAPAHKLLHTAFFENWLACGCHGEMAYLAKNVDKRMDVRKLYPPAQSVISVADNYYFPLTHSQNPANGKISRYAWGRNYHKVVEKKLKTLLKKLKENDSALDGRYFVDTAPIMDKLWAVEAGLGWQGKHSNLITHEFGSWVFLGELVINKTLPFDHPGIDRCGTCTACIDACPTGAIVAPYQLDARKCISYLTIELRDQPIGLHYRGQMENWVFGCDICQQVCPWNKKFARPTDERDYHPFSRKNIETRLQELLQMNEDAFYRRFRGTPVMRAKWHNFIRNVKTCT